MSKSAKRTPAATKDNGQKGRNGRGHGAASRSKGTGPPKIPKITVAQNPQPADGVFTWNEDQPAGKNAVALGQRLASYGDLFRRPGYGDGLILIPPDGKHKLVTKGAELAPIVVDRVPLQVIKDGTIKGNKIGVADLNTLVRAETFLGQFRAVDLVTTTPMFLPDWTLTNPGYNDGGKGHRIYYVGGQPP